MAGVGLNKTFVFQFSPAMMESSSSSNDASEILMIFASPGRTEKKQKKKKLFATNWRRDSKLPETTNTFGHRDAIMGTRTCIATRSRAWWRRKKRQRMRKQTPSKLVR
jgi:hypothetical protein